MELSVACIGKVRTGETCSIEVEKRYAPGLAGLAGFSHVLVLWHADKAPRWDPAFLILKKPYRAAPEKLGLFATRSPLRPGGVCVSAAEVAAVDEETGRLELRWIDAEDGSPVLDIKPYHPSSDLVRDAKVPGWCSHWPASYEESSAFDWEGEFLF